MSTYKTFGAQTYYLGSSIGSTDTSILLSSFLEPVTNTPYTMALLATDIVYATIAPKTDASEFISFTGITQNANGTATLTGVTRGLARKSPFTSDSAYKLPHSGQSQFVISNPPQLYNKFAAKEDTETITGVWSFSTSPTVPTGGTGTQAANATDIANAITGFAGTATNLVAGSTKISVAAVTPSNPIAVGDNDGRVPTQAENDALVGNNTDVAVGAGNKFVTQTGLQHNAEKYAADTSGSTTAYVAALSPIPTSYTTGMVFYIKIVNANTTTTPTLNINSLGAKTIVKGNSVALAVGDIPANWFAIFEYDGTNLVLQNPKTYFDYQSFTGSGTWTKPTGLTGNEMVIVQVWGAGGGGAGRTGNGAIGGLGGGGGGGGAFVERKFRASDLGSTVTVTVGAGGTGGAAGLNNGVAGGNTTFGSLVTAYGGGGGYQGTGGTGVGGGGGGGGGNNAAGATGASNVGAAGGGFGGGAANASATNSDGGAGGSTADANTPGSSANGGGGGGGGASGSLQPATGGNSFNGGAGGGGGGSTAGGTAGGTSVYGGAGGAGGKSGASGATPVAPVAGSAPGGGGGGGGGREDATSRAGADGAVGACRVWVLN